MSEGEASTALALPPRDGGGVALRRGLWWNPASWFLVSTDEAAAKLWEVRRHADAIHGAVLGVLVTVDNASWLAAWHLAYADVLRWERERRGDLSGGPNTLDAPQIVGEGNERLRALRGWRAQAADRGIEVPGETPPDLVDLGIFEVRRGTLYLVAGVGGAAAIAALAYQARKKHRRMKGRRR